MRFSLRSFFIGLTLACVLLAGITQLQIACWETIVLPSGRGLRWRIGRLSCGIVDWSGDDRGSVIGVWWIYMEDDGGIGPRMIEVELASASIEDSAAP